MTVLCSMALVATVWLLAFSAVWVLALEAPSALQLADVVGLSALNGVACCTRTVCAWRD